MGFLNKMREQKLLSISLIIFTLSVGIVIGTVISTGVNAAKSQVAAPDATPLRVPPVSTMPGNQFVELARKLELSVVNISTEYTPKTTDRRRVVPPEEEGEGEEDGMDLFRRFFRNGPEGVNPRLFRRHATGSGFVVDKNGYILTNHHVVEKADQIKVRMPHEKTDYRAKMIGFDVETDLAVIKIDAGKPLQSVRIGNSDSVQVGDWAVAIGSPFGLEATVTAGIVSATGRNIDGAQQFQRFIQTDAAINPGNSGGPLLNINGEVIGINTAIATATGGYQGVGFALPVNMAVNVYNSIIRTGKMSRGSIGIQFRPYENSQELMRGLGLKDGGVIIDRVMPGGPAERAGLKKDDIIVAYNGKPVKDGDELVNRVSTTPIGTTTTITVDREGKKMDFQVTIGDREEQLVASNDPRYSRPDEVPAESRNEATQARFGISIRPANDAERTNAVIEGKGGVVVTQVQEGSFAEEIGLRERDIIVAINRQPVNSVEDVKTIQQRLKGGDAVAFRVMRPSPQVAQGGNRPTPEYNGIYFAGTLPAE
jgi:serine protease Do